MIPMMEVIESEPTVLKIVQLIVLCCIEEVERNYIFSTANSLRLCGRTAHMSIIEKLEERTVVLLYDIDDDEAERLQHMRYLLWEKVLSK